MEILKESKCIPYRSKAGNICSKQLKTITTFKSQQTSKTWAILHNTNCKTEYAIYLTECAICNIQYISKNETPFNIKLSNRRKDVKDPKAILVDKHFQKSGHTFNKYARFTIIDTLINANLDTEVSRKRLIQRENFGYKNYKLFILKE